MPALEQRGDKHSNKLGHFKRPIHGYVHICEGFYVHFLTLYPTGYPNLKYAHNVFYINAVSRQFRQVVNRAVNISFGAVMAGELHVVGS